MPEQVNFAFLHGGGQGSWVWEPTLHALRSQHSGGVLATLALDVPGCGTKRGRETSELSLQDVAEELIADLKETGLDEIILVGHSQAGQVVSLMVEREPALFRRLIYVSCSIPSPGQTVREMIGTRERGAVANEVGWPFDPSQTDLSTRYPLMFCNDMGPAQRDAFLAELGKDAWPPSAYRFTDWRYEHHKRVASTFVVCLKDSILPVEWQESFAARFCCERIVRLDAGHQAMTTRPHALAEILMHEALCGEEK